MSERTVWSVRWQTEANSLRAERDAAVERVDEGPSTSARTSQMQYCGKCGAYRPGCEVLRNQYVCMACCYTDLGWWQTRATIVERRVAELEAAISKTPLRHMG